jgi:FMN phosphatase YigB (HAD superfamily)
MIDWVFLDVGNVLFIDDPQNFQGYRFVHELISKHHADYTFDAMLAEREKWALTGADFILRKIVRRLLPELDVKAVFAPLRSYLVESYDEFNLLHEGTIDVLQALRSRWRLGIIANQPPECRKSLARRGLLDFFDVVAISDELDLHKPDRRLYEWAISQAGCDPARAVMVGDRRDNDIAPAKDVSMRAILLNWADCRSRGWKPADPLARAFIESCDRVPLFSAVPVGPEPDFSVVALSELPAAVASLAGKKNPPAR